MESLINDPILGKTKFISEGWDPAGLTTIGKFPHGWADWNPGMRDTLKRFAKGMGECGPELTRRIEGSPDMFWGRTPDSSINYVTSHDGFTLYDTVAYNVAHNEANVYSSPMDTEYDNCSWNCGVEGETDDAAVLALRRRQMKNMMTILMLSRGVPMFWAGDEFANTQYGNNNAYSNDSLVSWLDWNRLDTFADVFEYTKRLIALRKAHPVMRKADYYVGYNASGYPELSWHGGRAWEFDRDRPFLSFAFMYAEPAADSGTEGDCFIYCAYNAHWEEHSFELPIIPAGMSWHVALDSYDESFEHSGARVEGSVSLMPRSCVVLVGERG